MTRLTEDVEIHDNLNPKLWENNKLKPEVRKKLIAIANEFESYVEAHIKILDVQLCGSNASYNYTAKSDIDLHLIVSFNMPGIDTNEAKSVLHKLYYAKTKSFNDKYDIMIYGSEVQIYVQDVAASCVSNGIYSVCENAWVKEPKKITSAKHDDLSEEMEKWNSRVAQILHSKDVDGAKGALDRLYLIRHNSLAADGEFGKGNQLFKNLRANGIIDKLNGFLEVHKEKQLSLEDYNPGQMVNRLWD